MHSAERSRVARAGAASVGMVAAMVLALAAFSASARAQRTAEPERRHVAGVVSRGGPKGPEPLPGAWVVLHRVGQDHAGPLDSTRTDARGRYAFSYHATGAPDALYFASSSHDGIAYFTIPLAKADVRGDDAGIFVFDTTSAPVRINVVGRHLVVGVPDADGAREVVEVLDLGNDSSVTRVAAGAERPVWTTPLPDGARNPHVNPTGEIAASSVRFDGGRVKLYAPLSPGGRQFSYSYSLGASSLPLALPLETGAQVLEVLLEEPRATVAGARLEEVAPASTGGRTFRRFLARDVPSATVLRVSVPAGVESVRGGYLAAMGATGGAAMLAALVVALRRRRRTIAAARTPSHARSDVLLREIAALDARVAREERDGALSADARAALASARAELKTRLAGALAEERPSA